MCDPVTIIAATALAAAGSAASTVSAMQQQTYQARMADRNAKLENEAARDALDSGRTEEQRYQGSVSQQQGAIRAALAANGIDIGYGSALDYQGDLAMFGQQDAATIRENSMREARGLEINASNYTAEAAAKRQARTGTLVKGVVDFGSTILGGAQQYRDIRTRRAP